MRITDDEFCMGVHSADGAAPICQACVRQTLVDSGVYIAPVAYRDAAGEWQCVERRSAGALAGVVLGAVHDTPSVCRPACAGNPETVGGGTR